MNCETAPILRCPFTKIPNAGIIESINFYEKRDEAGDIYIQNFKEGNKNKLFKIIVNFIDKTEYKNIYLDLKPDDICFLSKPTDNNLAYFINKEE